MEYPTGLVPIPEVTDEESAQLESIGTVIRFPSGSLIVEEGETTNFALLVLTGHVKIVKGEHGRIVALRGPGEVVGGIAAVLDSPRTASIYAIGEVSARYLPAPDWLEFLHRHPRAMFAQLHSTARQLNDVADKVAETILGSEQKLAKALIRMLASGVGEAEPGSVALRFNQQELADIAGVSRESVVQVIRNLKAAGIVSTGRHLTRVIDQVELKSIADGTSTVASS